MNNIEMNNNNRVIGPLEPIGREHHNPIHDIDRISLFGIKTYEQKSFSTNTLNTGNNLENDPNIYMLNPNSNWTRNFNGPDGFAEINVRQNDKPLQNQG